MHTTFMTKESGTHTQKHSWPMPYAFKLLDHSENNCYPERRVHMVRVSGCESGNGVQALRLHSSRKLQRTCAVVFSRFYGSHRIKGVEVGVELRGGVARSVASAILSTIAASFRPDNIFTWRATWKSISARLHCHVGL